MNKKISILCLTLFSCSLAFTQVNHGGEPHMWSTIQKKDLGICGKTFMALETEKLLSEDAHTDQDKSQPYRFGIEHDVEWSSSSEGIFKYLENGDRIWYLPIKCIDAFAISVTFSEFKLMPGAQLFIWDQKKEGYLGSFTHENNKEWGSFATQLIHSDRIVVEVYEPKKTIGKNIYTIGTVVQAYRSILPKFQSVQSETQRGPFGNSGPCNINVNCPEGLDWQDEKTSVALITSGGFAACSGALINNAAQDATPYFLTADHCLGGQNNWVFYFNHETEECIGNTGPTNMSISGSSLLANASGSDFALLELSEAIPDDFNACFAGWDNSDIENVSAAVGIHHPAGDLKKICFEDDAPYHNFAAGAQVWYIDEWELGVTEGGSSGSPLFDQNHRIIGQLYGGAAACSGSVNNGQFDYYGRLGVSWDGTSSSNRLRDWLDPGNSGITVMDTYCPNAITYETDGQIQTLLNIPNEVCDNSPLNPAFNLKNNGTNPLTSASISYSYNSSMNGTINWSGNLAEDEVEAIGLPQFTPVPGVNTIEVALTSINGGATDQNSLNDAIYKEVDFSLGFISMTVEILTDDYGYETYWEIRNESGTVVLSGGNEAVGIDGGGQQTAGAGDPGAYENNTLYSETYQIPSDACYSFEIVDDYADGICCGFGEGSYSVVDGTGTILIEGGSFGATDLTSVGMNVETLGLASLNDLQISVFPNPAQSILNINSEKNLVNARVQLFNMVGQEVRSISNINGNRVEMNVEGVESGIYTLQINSQDGAISERIIVQ
ncbi:MAG: T9SS type A sorting domain-containing protein [Bacteroidota bacterium]